MRRTKNFKFAPIRKRFRDSESASLYEQKCPPHHFPNPRGYQDTTKIVKILNYIGLNFTKNKTFKYVSEELEKYV